MVSVRGLLVWLALAVTANVAAQEPVEATVDRAVVRVNESFTYVLRAEGAVRGSPDPPAELCRRC